MGASRVFTRRQIALAASTGDQLYHPAVLVRPMLFELCDKMSQLPNPQVMPRLVMIPSAPFDKRSLVPTCLVGNPSWMYNFHHPCLLASSPPVLLCTPANDNRSSAPALLFIPSQ
jgi:hypothetical protein